MVIRRLREIRRVPTWFLPRMTRAIFAGLLVLFTVHLSAAEVRVAGQPLVPEGLILGEAEPKNRISGEGELADGCEWELLAETRIGTHRVEKEKPDQDCVQYFYVTSVRLIRKCPAPASPIVSRSERLTTTGPHCPDAKGTIVEPRSGSSPVSQGVIPDGRRQVIAVQPDGTRLTLRSNEQGVEVVIVYRDGTSDVLLQKAEVEPAN